MQARNNYALITGASDGFGKALAIECARQHINLVLVALPGPELFQLSSFIRRNFFVDVKNFEKDLTQEQQCYQLYQEIIAQNIPINILINNAGMGNTGLFTDSSPSFFTKQIKLNVLATTLITNLLVSELKRNGPSHILNVGSLCSFFYLPQKQIYGGTKSFIYFFSKSLRCELKKDGVSVSVVCPGGMNTNFQVSLLNRNANFFSRLSILNPEQVAPFVIEKMLKGQEVIIPGVLNRFTLILDKLLPSFIKKIITNKLANDLKPVSINNVQPTSSPIAA